MRRVFALLCATAFVAALSAATNATDADAWARGVATAKQPPSEPTRYRRVTIDAIPCDLCGGPMPIGISLLVPEGWKITMPGDSTWNASEKRGGHMVTVLPANEWDPLPSPDEVRARLVETFRHSKPKPPEIRVRAATVAGVRAVVESISPGNAVFVTYLFEGRSPLFEGRSTPVVGVGFIRDAGRDRVFDSMAARMIRSVRFVETD